jgi:hypothetical protein
LGYYKRERNIRIMGEDETGSAGVGSKRGGCVE